MSMGALLEARDNVKWRGVSSGTINMNDPLNARRTSFEMASFHPRIDFGEF